MQQKARVKLTSTDIEKLNDTCDYIRGIVEKTGVNMKGPVPLPTKTLKVTTRKRPCGKGTAPWDRYARRIHKRIIDLGLDERALRLVMKMPIPPEGLDIEIEMINE